MRAGSAAASGALPSRGLRVRRRSDIRGADDPAGWSREAWSALIDRARDSEVLKASPGALVMGLRALARGPEGNLVVKALRARGVLGAARWMLGCTRLDRQWARAAVVRARTRATVARDVVLCSSRDGAGAPWTLLISERVEGSTLLRTMADARLGGRARGRLARASGALVAELANGGLMNRDLKPSNVLVREGDGALVLIDLAGVVVLGQRVARERALVPMLASLVIEPSGCEVEIRRTDRARAVWACAAAMDSVLPADRRGERRRLWRLVEARVRAHGDPTPKNDPLGGEA